MEDNSACGKMSAAELITAAEVGMDFAGSDCGGASEKKKRSRGAAKSAKHAKENNCNRDELAKSGKAQDSEPYDEQTPFEAPCELFGEPENDTKKICALPLPAEKAVDDADKEQKKQAPSKEELVSEDNKAPENPHGDKDVAVEPEEQYTTLWCDNKLEEIRAERCKEAAAKKKKKKKKKSAKAKNTDSLFFSKSDMPIYMDMHIAKLTDVYGGAVEYGDTRDSHLMWFEEVPHTNRKAYEKRVKKMSKKKRLRHEELEKRYAGYKTPYKKDCVDVEYMDKVRKRNKKLCFDYREVWNLDYALTLRIYSMLCEFRDTTIGYEAEFSSQEEYFEKVLNPIIDGMGLYIMSDEIDVYGWGLEHELPTEAIWALEKRIYERTEQAYKMLSEHILGLWD